MFLSDAKCVPLGWPPSLSNTKIFVLQTCVNENTYVDKNTYVDEKTCVDENSSVDENTCVGPSKTTASPRVFSSCLLKTTSN